MWAVLVSCVGCYASGPELSPPQVVGLRGELDDGTRIDGAGASGAGLKVPRLAAIRVAFDRLLLPASVSRQSVRLVSGATAALSTVRFDPATREAVIEPFIENPLAASTRYRVVVDGVQDLSGAVLVGPVSLDFETTDELGRWSPRHAVPFAEVAPIFEGCATSDCHAGPTPVSGLDLSSGEGLRRTALGQPSKGALPRGNEALDGAFRLTDLALIDARDGRGRPEYSYLMYKVLGASEVLGERMPPPAEATALDAGRVSLLSDWILAGAATE